jgi:hypothetical protein
VLTRNPPVTWLVYAVCAKPMPKYLRQDVTLAPGPHQTGKTCPPGLNVFSGGTRRDDLVVEVQSFPALNPTQWVMSLDSFALAQSELDLYVVCADLPAGYTITGTTVPPDEQEGIYSQCPVGLEHVVGGGVSHNGTFGEIVVPASRPLFPELERWEAYVDHYDINDSANAVNFAARAVCSESVN